jgi:hypothetical protein
MSLYGTPEIMYTALALGVSSAVIVLLYRALRAPSKALPQFASASMMETLAALSNPTGVVSFLTELTKQSPSAVFRIRMPDSKPFVVVGEPKLARAILDDATSAKPDFMYQASELMSFGMPSVCAAYAHP